MMDTKIWSMFHLLFIVIVLILVGPNGHTEAKMGKIIFAVNAGGDSHTDVLVLLELNTLFFSSITLIFLFF